MLKKSNFHKRKSMVAQADRLMITRPDRLPSTFIMHKRKIFIGRSHKNDIVLDAPEVSHWHACLKKTADGWQCSDLNSSSGTYLDQQRLADEVVETWQPGQTLCIGPYQFNWLPASDRTGSQPVLAKMATKIKAALPLTGILLVLVFSAIFAFFYQGERAGALTARPTPILRSNSLDGSPFKSSQVITAPVEGFSGVRPVNSPDINLNSGASALPVIFNADFDEYELDPAIWAYHLYKGVAVVREGGHKNEWSGDANPVLQLGHPDEWSAIALESGNNWRNYVVEMDVNLLEFVQDADTFFLGVRHDRIAGEYVVSLDVAAQKANLSTTINGLWEGVIHETPLALDAEKWYQLKAHVYHHQISFFVDGNHIGSIDNATLHAGTIRMLTSPGSLVYVDNITVKEIPSLPEPDDLLITEIMFRDGDFQWFEIFNHSDRHILIDGMEISNGVETHQIAPGSLVIKPHSYMVFASQDTAPYFSLDFLPYIYGDSLRFPPDNGYLRLSADGQIIAEIEYSEDTGWLLQDDVSLALHPDYHTPRRQNNGFHWCPSVEKVSDNSSMRATPGRPNHVCVRELPFHQFGNRQTGELIITEIMIDLPGPDQGREWFEVYNPNETPFSLKGMTIATNSPAEKHKVTEEFTIPPRGYAILAQAGLLTSELPDDLPIYYYAGHLTLRNNNGELVLSDGERVLDSVTWRDNGWWPFRAGMSMSLHPDALSAYANDDALNWCLAWTPITDISGLLGTPGKENDPCNMWEINSPLQDVSRAYEAATLAPVTMHITIDPNDLDRMKANPFSNKEYPIRFSADGYDIEQDDKATMRPRGGNFTRAAETQSYNIRLEEPFQDHRTLLLNKHDSDPSRLRNALSFQLFQGMENMVSLRTQFVHLFVNDEDFGLYTMVESRGSRMLRNHHLDARGHLFNIEYGFFLYQLYDRERRINSILDRAELQVGHNHDGLITMMDAVYSEENIHHIIDRHFNRENLLTYFASVYLMQNLDTRAKNYLLYSTPREPQRFYFIPWDWDLAFFPPENKTIFVGSWREGLGNWVGIGIVDRMLREPELVDALIFKMVELAQTSLSQERVSTLVDQLAGEVEPFTRRQPELQVMTPQSLWAEVNVIKDVIKDSARQLVEIIERPLPLSVDTAIYDTENQAVTFYWNDTVSLQNRQLSYEVVFFIESRWDENNIVWRSMRTTDTSLTITEYDIPEEVSAGQYYWMVYVWDDIGNYNTSYNMDEFGVIDNVVNLP